MNTSTKRKFDATHRALLSLQHSITREQPAAQLVHLARATISLKELSAVLHMSRACKHLVRFIASMDAMGLRDDFEIIEQAQRLYEDTQLAEALDNVRRQRELQDVTT